jgi:hypothetical protein
MINASSNLCTADAGYSMNKDTQYVQWLCDGGWDDSFEFLKNSDGSYTIKNPESNMCMDVLGATSGSKVAQYPCDSLEDQEYLLSSTASGVYTVKSKSSGLCVSFGGSHFNGTGLVLAACGGDGQSFKITLASTAPAWPVTIPNGAVAYPSVEQESGWVADAGSSISPHPPTVYTINQSGPPVKMTLTTKGTSGLYTGWMAHKSISTSGQLNMLIRSSYTFDSVSGIQAWEMGRRSTNASKVTDNGQTQLVPITGGLLEFDIVPSSSGGWKDTGCRFPTFVAGTTYNEELYYVNDSSGALSLMYVSLNGALCAIPQGLQSIAGASLGWSADGSVLAFQPDANPSAATYNAVVKMSAWMW